MPRSTFIALAAILAIQVAACGHDPIAVVGPTLASVTPAPAATAGSGGRLSVASEMQWGAQALWSVASIGQIGGFTCVLGPFGTTDDSHFTVSASGNELMVCNGDTAFLPDQAFMLEGFPCQLPSGTVAIESRLVITPSGHATLTCRS
jgi:hypothetical protein